jgi:hypothetical protein
MFPDDTPPSLMTRGHTPREVARLYRVSPDRVRAWIKSGELGAVNIAHTRCGKPRFVVLPHHLSEFEQRRKASTTTKPPRRRRREPAAVDYYPD